MNINKLLELELNESCLDYHGVLKFNFNNKVITVSGGNITNIPNDINLLVVLTEKQNVYNKDFLIYHYAIVDFNIPKKDSFQWFMDEVIEKLKENNIMKLHVACGQGHGRTGIFLVLLSVNLLNISIGEAINFVKKNYCKNIIENDKQLSFLLNY